MMINNKKKKMEKDREKKLIWEVEGRKEGGKERKKEGRKEGRKDGRMDL
jgi:hypothetical protein